MPCSLHRLCLPASQNHRMVGVGKDLWGSSSPPTLPKQGHLEQAAQDLIQVGFEYLQRMRLHNPSEKFQCSITLKVKKFFLMFRGSSLCFRLCQLPPVLPSNRSCYKELSMANFPLLLSWQTGSDTFPLQHLRTPPGCPSPLEGTQTHPGEKRLRETLRDHETEQERERDWESVQLCQQLIKNQIPPQRSRESEGQTEAFYEVRIFTSAGNNDWQKA